MKRLAWVAAVCMVLGSSPAWAARLPVHDAAESQEYGTKFGGMLGRGLLNAATCFVDIIVNTVNETKVGPPLVGTLTGVAMGVGCGALRLGSGALDIVTSWVPGFNGIPVSDSYDNCLAPGTPAQPSADMTETPSSPALRPATEWEVPSAEPGAAQTPASEPQAAPKTWTK